MSDEVQEGGWEADPEYHAYLSNIQDEINSTDEFERTYGFPHKCHCAEDYAEGNVGLVSDCWSQMSNDALDTCKYLKQKVDALKVRCAELKIELAHAKAETPA